MRILFTASLLLFTTFCFSQKINGKVLNYETNEPIERAHIFVSNEAIYSDVNGEFTFNLDKSNSIIIRITHIKFAEKTVVYKLNPNKKITIYLEEKSEALNEIVINTERKLKMQLNFKRLDDLPRATYAFTSILKDGKIHLFGGDISSEFEKNKEGLAEQVFFSNEEEIMKVLQRPKPINFDFFLGDYQVYDIATKTWKYKKDKFLKRAYHNSVVYKDDVYIFGGKSFSKKKFSQLLRPQIEIFSTKDSLIALDQTNPHQAVNMGTAIYQDKILAFGGSTKMKENGNKEYSNEIHFYDLKSGNWYFLTKMLKGKEVKGIIFKDKLYLIGGYYKKSLTEITSFDFVTGKWKKEGDLFKGMRNPSLTKDNEFIYIQEGSTIVTFKPKTNTLKEYNMELRIKDANMHFYNESLFLLGGFFVESYRKQPSASAFKIDVIEFLTTKPSKTIRF